MKGQITDAATPEEYIAKLDEPRRSQIAQLHEFVRKAVPKLEPFIHSGMLAYGPFHYKYSSGREGDWFRIGIASNKSYISLYACAADARGYVAERYKDKLPKANIGKSCVRFKRVEDLDLTALKALLKETEKTGFSI